MSESPSPPDTSTPGPAPAPAPAREGRKFWWALIGFTALWCVYLTWFGPGGGAGGGLPRPILDRSPLALPADLNWSVRALDGGTIDLARYRGRPVFLNFWATWCPPCVAEMPTIEALAADPRLQGVAFLAISMDSTDAAAQRFVQRNRMRVPVGRPSGEIPAMFQTDGIPATFIIGPDGNLVVQEVGAAQWDHPDVVRLLERLATPGPPAGATP